ncbi:hypothetical protein [Erwinia sp. CGal63]|uniref:hypothetical protein n=1 Tax=Erwinia sp. CGal63 TaxID=2919889 RepID=UPI0030090D29
MVNNKFLFAIMVFLFPGQPFADRVVKIEIEKTGIAYKGRSEVEQEGCKLFRPTEKQLIQYFNQAQRLEFGGWREHKYYSPCIVIGRVTFKEGMSGRFTLQSSGFGYGVFNHQQINFFNEFNPWFDPFQCTYAMGDEVEPGCD